jgi:nitrogen regulatory protein PII
VAEAIKAAEATQRSHYGVLLSMDVIDFYRAGDDMSSFIEKDSTMDNNNLGGELIQVIVNKGYADDAMAAARKAGAFGGTVINARGTAKPDDKKFFGMQIVPEKEILLIVVPKDKATEVYNAICSISCLSEKGSGIVFRLPVCGYELLGK